MSMLNHSRSCQTPLETGDILVEKLCISILKKQMLSLLSHIKMIGRDILGRKLEARSRASLRRSNTSTSFHTFLSSDSFIKADERCLSSSIAASTCQSSSDHIPFLSLLNHLLPHVKVFQNSEPRLPLLYLHRPIDPFSPNTSFANIFR